MIFWFLRTKKHNREIVLVERNFIDRGFYNGVRARCDEVWSSTGGKWFECGNTLFSCELLRINYHEKHETHRKNISEPTVSTLMRASDLQKLP
tara:strand:- start:413 stop:691 length:279 start_codon:yes stop_codon:yes gene_type:complete